jgi:hypothetical protein
MTDRLVHLAATARHMPMTERDSVHEAEVRAMQRGLRGLAARGISGRPTGFRVGPRIMLRKSRLDNV